MARPTFDFDSWMSRRKNTHTASCSRRSRDMAIPGGGSSHYGVQRNLRMHACVCRGCRGWASLSTRSPKGLLPFGQGGSVFFPFSFCQHKGRRYSKSATAFVHKGINHLKPRFFFPFDIGHNSWTMGLLWSLLLALVEDITPPSLRSILLSITQVLLNIV